MNMIDPSEPQGVCAPGPQEHSLCGWAPDAYESGDVRAPVIFASAGEQVTCQGCRAVLEYVRHSFKRYRYVG